MKNTLRQELREKAKNHIITMGVLSVRNNVNGKEYIQGALNLEALVNKMNFLLKGNLFTNKHLQKDWNEQGEGAFTFEFVKVIPPQENKYVNHRQEIARAEQSYISENEDTEFYES